MDRRDYTTRAKKIAVLDKAINRFDSLLEEIQEQMPEEFEFYERIVNVRDAMYRLKACMRDCVIMNMKYESGPSDKKDSVTTADLHSWFPIRDEEEEDYEEEDDDDDDNERRRSQLVR